MRFKQPKFRIIYFALAMALFSCVGQPGEDDYKRGNAKNNHGDYKGAIADYSNAIEQNPDFADAYCNRGIAKGKLGDANGACSDFKKAAELGNERANDLLQKHCR